MELFFFKEEYFGAPSPRRPVRPHKAVLRILSFLGNLRSENIEMLNENSQIRIIRCLKYFLAPIEATDTTVRSAKVCIGP